jgi:hypothetical protein
VEEIMSTQDQMERSSSSRRDGDLAASRGHAARGTLAGKAGAAIEGVFQNAEDASNAVNDLLAQSVPADEIEVYLISAGAPPRKLRIREDSGTRRGALTGAIVGALIGFLIGVLASLGALGEAWTAILMSGTPLDVLSLMIVSAVVGVPIGAVIGMGYWRGRRSLQPIDGHGERVMVAVETAELADVARGVLREAGAIEVRG